MKNILKKIDRRLWNFKIWQVLTGIPRQAGHIYRKIRKFGYQEYRRIQRLEKQAEREKMAALKRQEEIAWRLEEKWFSDESIRKPKTPTVSIIMPVYNSEKYLKEAIDSLLAQSLKHIEIITVDDGSTDDSLQILKAYAAADRRVRVFTQKNQYAGVARNKGLKYAKGEYVLFLDSDDYFDPELIREAYSAAKLNKEKKDADVVMFGARCYHNERGTSWVGKHLLDVNYVPRKQMFTCMDCPDTIFQISNGCPWTKLFRREFIKKTKLQYQNLHNANDVYFVFSALTMAESIVTLNKQLVTYRVGLTDNLQSSKKRYFFEAYTALYYKLKEMNKLEPLQKSFTNRTMDSCLYNLRVVEDPAAKRAVFERLKNETFKELEIFGHEKAYYYNEKNYEELLLVENCTFEQYMEVQQKQ